MTFFSPFQRADRRQRLGRDRRHRARRTRTRTSSRDQRDPRLRRHGDRDRRRLDGLHGHVRRRLGGHRRAELPARRTSTAAAASPPSRRRTTAARTTRSRSTTTATRPRRSRTAPTTRRPGILARADADPAGGRHRHGRGLRRRRASTTRASRSPSAARWRATNVPVTARRCRTSPPGASGFVGETDKGGAVDNKGGIITPTGNSDPGRDGAGAVHDPAADAVRPHRERDGRGRRRAALLAGSRTTAAAPPGTSLLSNTKTNGPLFAMFPKSGPISEADTLLYNSPGENHLTTSPTRVFPDLAADPGQQHERRHRVRARRRRSRRRCRSRSKECFAEFLPTADYVGFAGTNAARSRCTSASRPVTGKGGGGTAAPTRRCCSPPTPGRSSSPRRTRRVTWPAGSTQTVTWNMANTNIAPVEHGQREDQLSDGRRPHVPDRARGEHPNDGSEAVTIPNVVDDAGPREDRGGRQRLLRRLERELHDRRTASASASTSASAAATSASATTATSATTSASTAATASATSAASTASAPHRRPAVACRT